MADDQTNLPELAEVIRNTTYNAWIATLIGSAPPVVRTLNDRMCAPKPGDMVIEATTIYRGSHLNAVGRLLRIVQEPVDFGPGAETWDEEVEGRPHPLEPATYIRTLDGREFRWINAQFLAVPADSPLDMRPR